MLIFLPHSGDEWVQGQREDIQLCCRIITVVLFVTISDMPTYPIYKYPRSTLSHTVSELCEMRDENIVWNELFAYDDIVKFIDYICIQ